MKVLLYPDPRLKAKAEVIEAIDDDLRRVAAEMVQTMHDYKGIGLAGNQVGYMRRLIVVSPDGVAGNELILVNPRVEKSRGRATAEEGCLSFPGVYGQVTRPDWVKVTALDLDGQEVVVETDGLLATILQHEIDHLDGILFVTKMSEADRVKLKKTLREMEEQAGGAVSSGA